MRNAIVYLLFTAGGFAALTYEVMWMRSFRLVFGSSTQSAAAVLAAYLGGMAIGSLLGARLARGSRRPLLQYGLAELAIGLAALAVAPWLVFYREIYPSLYPWAASNPALWICVKLLLALVALGPPTIAMGVTLPLVVRAIVPIEGKARAVGWLYALNVLGAMAGAAVAGFVLPMSVGVSGAVYFAVAINLVIGLVAIGLSRSVQNVEREPALTTTTSAIADRGLRPSRRGALVALAAASGFGTLALEVLYIRVLNFNTEGSVYSFGMMLVIFLLCLALGSAIVALCGDRSNLWRLIAVTQTVAMVAILLTPLFFGIASAVSGAAGESVANHLFWFAVVGVPTLGLPVVLMGIVLPATWKLATTTADEMGHTVGQLVAWNTVAAVAGSLLTGFVLLPRLGLGGSLLAVAAVYGAVAMIAYVQGFGRVASVVGCALCVGILAGWYSAGVSNSRQALAEGETLRSYSDGPSGSVAVIEAPNGKRTERVLKLNQHYTLGSSGSAARELSQGQVPLILHPNPRRVAFIGVATGITLSAVKDFPVERAVGIELVPEVVDTLPDFARWNRSIADDPRVELVVDDGRNFLLGTDEKFDVIVSDLFVPWQAGTGDLYTVEHFRTAADCLAEGGIFAQWLAGYQFTPDELRTITASLFEVFPAVTLWRNDFEMDQPLLCFVCYRDAARIDTAALAAICERFAADGGPPTPFLASPRGVSMLYIAGDSALREWAAGAPLNTDDHPYIEYTTPGSFLRHRQEEIKPVNEFMAGFRPRKWEYSEAMAADCPMDDALRAADLMHDAKMAQAANNFERQYQLLKELIPLASDVPAVNDLALRVAGDYRAKRMISRSDEVLSILSEQPGAPITALMVLADGRRGEGKLQESIDLLERAIERAPQAEQLRRGLVDVLKQAKQYDQVEEHLTFILERRPDDAFLRLDLASALDRQGKTEEAQQQIEKFRQLRLGDQRENAWRYLRGLDLGKYVDEAPGEAPAVSDEPPVSVGQEP